jgi:hypothetical protein
MHVWERKSNVGRPFHELIFVSRETASDRSHVSLEYLCPFPAEKYSGIPVWTRRNNLVHLKTTTTALSDGMEAERWR